MKPIKIALLSFGLAIISVVVIAVPVVSPYDTPATYVVGYSVIISVLMITGILAMDTAIPEGEWPIAWLLSRGTIGAIRSRIEELWRWAAWPPTIAHTQWIHPAV